jgi:geranylgeranyl diphosphate synthase type II
VSAFDIQDYLKKRTALIDRSLDRCLKESKRRSQTLHKAMRYGLFSGGKRLRPILTLAAGEMFGGEHRALLPFACALEMIHTYSIIHDDLPALDDDDFRRGAPASHKVFGEGIALLAGDALLTEAFHLMTKPEVARVLKPSLILELIHEISRAAGVGGMVGGQAVDLEAEGREVDRAAVEHIHALKTGALILTPVRIGAIIAGAAPKELRRMGRYAGFLGLAFQIADDIMDMADSDGGDGNGKIKATYPAVVGIAAAKSRLAELLQQSLKEVDVFGNKADPLRGIARIIVERAL